MAELVGDAYIRITADTDAMKRALAAQMRKAGKDGGHAFSEEVERAAKQSAKRAQQSFAKGIVDPKEFDRMAKNFDSVEHAAAEWGKQLTLLRKQGHVAKGQTVEYRKAIKAWEKQAVATRDAAKKLNDEWSEAIGINKRLTREQKEQSRQLRVLYERDHAEAMRMLREESALRKMVLNRDHAEALKMQEKWRRDGEKMRREMEAAQKKENERQILVERDHQKHLRDERNRGLKNFFNDQIRTLDAITKAREEAEKKAERRALAMQRIRDKKRGIKRDYDGNIIGRASSFGRGLDRLDHRLDKFGDKVGRMFGRGSRNNFVNLVGAMARGVFNLGAKLISFPLRIVGAFTDGFSAFFSTLKESGSLLKASGAGISALFSGLASSVPALIAAAGALFLFGEVIPGIVSGLSMLAGAVLATASAISYGLVGALLAVGPAAAGAALGLGGVFIAVSSFAKDKKNKKLMKEWFTDTFTNWSKQFKEESKSILSDAHDIIHTLLEDAAPATQAFFDSWDKNMKDADTKKFGGNISDSLGRIATTFNTSLPHALSGLIAFFNPIVPYAERLADAIARAFERFDAWANSAEGQTAISDFMATAWADANKVWLILVDIKDLIFTLFEQSEPTGAGILDGIHSKLQDIIGWLKDPANKGKIDEWFAGAKQMAIDVGELAGHLGDIIRNFNSEEGQKNAKELMTTINTIGAGAAKISELADNIGSVMGWLEKINDFTSLDPKKGIGGWLHDKIYGKDKEDPKKPPVTPQSIPTKTKEQVFAGRKDLVEQYRVATITPTVKFGKEQVKAIEDYQFKEKTIPIKGNEDLWAAMRDSNAAYVFTPKQIPVKGHMDEWNEAKGTAAGYVFDTKTIKVEGDTSDLKSAIASAKRYLSTLPANKTIRIAGVNGVGGITTAAGGVFDGAQHRIIGEAGPEAVVPLNRPLALVDPAVRQLSAIAQGMAGPKGLPAANNGPRVNFSEGAIQVNLPTGDPQLAAEAVLDRLVAYIG